MNKQIIPYGRQHITQDDIDSVIEVLQSDFLTQGPYIPAFEDAFAQYVGSKYAVAVANGTAALHLSAMAMGVSPGQKVITTPITFAASANSVRYCGGEVIFSDIDPKTYLIDIEKIRAYLENTSDHGIVGIIPVDFTGRAVNLEQLKSLANEFDLWIIEDACHAPGGHFIDSQGIKQRCGNGKFADLSIFSFHPVKHIASGEGGMITTNDRKLYLELLKLRSHGITKDESDYKNTHEIAVGQASSNVSDWPNWYMEMQELGYNYRLTDIQAALGLSQLKKANDGLKRRRQIAQLYVDKLNNLDGITNTSGIVEGHAYHLFVIEVENRLGLYNHLRDHNIYAQVHYIPTHLMPYYQNFGWKKGDLPEAENYYSGCLSLPMYPSLSEEEQKFVIEKIEEFMT